MNHLRTVDDYHVMIEQPQQCRQTHRQIVYNRSYCIYIYPRPWLRAKCLMPSTPTKRRRPCPAGCNAIRPTNTEGVLRRAVSSDAEACERGRSLNRSICTFFDSNYKWWAGDASTIPPLTHRAICCVGVIGASHRCERVAAGAFVVAIRRRLYNTVLSATKREHGSR